MDNRTDRIVPLDQMDDFKVADGDPDVRGWDVMSADGTKIGEVDNLLIDSTAMKVRYLDVDIDDDVLDGGDERHILIPIGYARLDEDDDQVFVDSLDRNSLGSIPAYTHEPLTEEYETSLQGYYGTGMGASTGSSSGMHAQGDRTGSFDSDRSSDERFFGSDRDSDRDQDETRLTRSEEELEISKRQHRAGEVEIDKHVETEHVSREVPVRHEEVVIERRPAEGMSASGRMSDDEVRIPVSEEELVVDKRTVPKEEIVVRKQERVENERVEAELKREEVDIHREGDVDVRDER